MMKKSTNSTEIVSIKQVRRNSDTKKGNPTYTIIFTDEKFKLRTYKTKRDAAFVNKFSPDFRGRAKITCNTMSEIIDIEPITPTRSI